MRSDDALRSSRVRRASQRMRVPTYNAAVLPKHPIASEAMNATPRQSSVRATPAGWDEEEDERESLIFKRLSREEAEALRKREPSVSPWRVVIFQLLVGAVLAVVTGLLTGSLLSGLSSFYGALCVVVPGALMARGMTSRFARLNAGVAAVSFMMWEFGKIGVSVVMLMLAPKLVHGVSWPALLVALIVCIKIYWVALLWRGSKKR